jgi:hypothetical protein
MRGDESVFPFHIPGAGRHPVTGCAPGFFALGITKRELFAAVALHALMGRDHTWSIEERLKRGQGIEEAYGAQAVAYADAALAELEKGGA